MVETSDFERLLQTGRWTTQRAKTPGIPITRSNHDDPVPRAPPTAPPPVSTPAYERPRPHHLQHLSVGPRRPKFPPSPSVEDEAESLARESLDASALSPPPSLHDDEEPKFRGEVDQLPILVSVQGNNPERRFVLVPESQCRSPDDQPASAIAERPDDTRTKPPNTTTTTAATAAAATTPATASGTVASPTAHKPSHHDAPPASLPARRGTRRGTRSEADTRSLPDSHAVPPRSRKHSFLHSDVDHPSSRHANRPDVGGQVRHSLGPRRKSRSELAADIDGHDMTQSRLRTPHQTRSTKTLEKSSPTHDRPPHQVIKHATNGRDRAYWDFSQATIGERVPELASVTTESPQGAGSKRVDGHIKSSQADTAGRFDRREESNNTIKPCGLKGPRRLIDRGDDGEDGEDAASTASLSARSITMTTYVTPNKSSPPRAARTNTLSAYPVTVSDRDREQEKLSHRPAGPRMLPADYEASDGRRPTTHHRHQKSVLIQDDRGTALPPSPEHPTGPSSLVGPRPNSRPGNIPTLPPSPIPSQMSRSDSASVVSATATSTNATRSSNVPVLKRLDRRDNRPPSPLSLAGTSPPREFRDKYRVDDERRMPSRTPSTPAPLVIPPPSSSQMTVMSDDRVRTPAKSRPSMPPSSHTDQPSVKPTPAETYWNAPASGPSDERKASEGQTATTTYRRYTEDVARGTAEQLSECRRSSPIAGYDDWLTLPRAESFDVCPSCFDAVFAWSEFRPHFVRAPPRSPSRPVRCNLGSSFWYHIAWFFTRKHHLPDLRLFHGIAGIEARHQPCAGDRSVTRVWCSINDPHTRRPVANFNVCFACAKMLEVLFANLVGVFVPLDNPPEPARGVCAMYFHPERRRFFKYFDFFETVSDRAISRQSAPNVQYLADMIRQLSLVDECERDEPVPDGRWHILPRLPELTVCEECFDDVVWPLVEPADGERTTTTATSGYASAGSSNDQGSEIARSFHARSKRLPLANCHLYSDRMRAIFWRACRKNDWAYLADKVKERLRIEGDIRTRLALLDDREILPEGRREEVERLVAEWKKWQ